MKVHKAGDIGASTEPVLFCPDYMFLDGYIQSQRMGICLTAWPVDAATPWARTLVYKIHFCITCGSHGSIFYRVSIGSKPRVPFDFKSFTSTSSNYKALKEKRLLGELTCPGIGGGFKTP